METAARYTFTTVRDRPVACFAHVTNQMGQNKQDFEKGEADGSQDALEVVAATTSPGEHWSNRTASHSTPRRPYRTVRVGRPRKQLRGTTLAGDSIKIRAG